ncbi:6-phosphofructokinase [Candidatus Woesearchaeota archaeon]|nr:6-phosphofructokinase [Candidatus Woesearchaeota archaeon]
MKRIGIITSGGDCGGLNAVIKGVASMANALGIVPLVIPNGYAGLYNLIDLPDDKLTVLSNKRLSVFSATVAGSEAGHSRVKISKIKDENKYDRIKQGLAKHKIDALVVSGGDDSGSVVVDLCDNGIPTNHAPKTMDLDLQTYSVGGDSTLNNIARAIEDLKTTAKTHNRIMVLEVFGRYVGHSAFRGGVAGDADCILIPEIVPDFDVIYDHMSKAFTERVLHSDVHTGNYMIVAAEAMKGDPEKDDVNEEGFLVDKTADPDAFGHYPLVGAGKKVEKELKARLKKDERMKMFMKQAGMYVEGQYEIPEVRVIRPTHLMRCGDSSAFDVNFGREAGAGAVYLLTQGIYGITCAGVSNGMIQYLPTKEAIKQNPVNLDQVSLFEMQGICFGRKPQGFNPGLTELKGKILRHI